MTVVDNVVHDNVPGMECMTAMGGCCDTYTQMNRYRRVGSDRLTEKNDISALAHLSSLPLIAYTLFDGLISNEVELIDA